MTIDPQLLELMTQTVGLEVYSRQDRYGRPVYGAIARYPCRVTTRQHEVRGKEGDVQVARSTVYLGQAIAATAKSRVTLPDGSVQVVLEVRTYPDELGDYYTELHCA